jgi:hypothetical protein
MALLTIQVQPTGTEAFVTSVIQLEGRQWTWRFYKNSVIKLWFWDLINDAQETVIEGEGMSMRVDMLAKFRALDIPPGWLFCAEQGEGTSGDAPDVDAFRDGRAVLYYLESE